MGDSLSSNVPEGRACSSERSSVVPLHDDPASTTLSLNRGDPVNCSTGSCTHIQLPGRVEDDPQIYAVTVQPQQELASSTRSNSQKEARPEAVFDPADEALMTDILDEFDP